MGSALGAIGSVVGTMTGIPGGGAIGGAIGSAIGGSDGGGGGGNSQAATQGAQQQYGANQASTEWANGINRDNAMWAMNQNQLAADRALGNNRVNQTSDFGSTSWNQDPNGKWSQTNSIAPEQQAMLDSLRGKQAGAIDSMGGGFDVNGDVMNAYRAQQQPMLNQQRDAENARLAAMGLSTGSGMAWGNAQDALGRTQNDADQKAILAGFNADQQMRASNRADLSTLNSTETGWKNNSLQPSFAQQGATTMGQLQVNPPATGDFGNAAELDRKYQNAVAAAKASGNMKLVDTLMQEYKSQKAQANVSTAPAGSGAADAASWANMGSGVTGSGAGNAAGWSSNGFNGTSNSSTSNTSGWDWLPSYGPNTSGMDW